MIDNSLLINRRYHSIRIYVLLIIEEIKMMRLTKNIQSNFNISHTIVAIQTNRLREINKFYYVINNKSIRHVYLLFELKSLAVYIYVRVYLVILIRIK